MSRINTKYNLILTVFFLLLSIFLFNIAQSRKISNVEITAVQKKIKDQCQEFEHRFYSTCFKKKQGQASFSDIKNSGNTKFSFIENERGIFFQGILNKPLTKTKKQAHICLVKTPLINNEFVGPTLSHSFFPRNWIVSDGGVNFQLSKKISVKIESKKDRLRDVFVVFLLFISLIIYVVLLFDLSQKTKNNIIKTLVILFVFTGYFLWIFYLRHHFNFAWFADEEFFFLNPFLPDFFSFTFWVLVFLFLNQYNNYKTIWFTHFTVLGFYILSLLLGIELTEKSSYLEGVKSFSSTSLFPTAILILMGMLIAKAFQIQRDIITNLNKAHWFIHFGTIAVTVLWLNPPTLLYPLPFLMFLSILIKKNWKTQLQYLLFILSIGLFVFAQHNESKKESIAERKLLAVQLSENRDFELELSIIEKRKEIKQNEGVFSAWFLEKPTPKRSWINWKIQRSLFKSGYSDYKISILILDTSNQVFYQSEDDLLSILKEPYIDSEIDTNLKYYAQSKYGCSYLFDEKIRLLGQDRKIIFIFKNKKIPEDIGIPTLLIPKTARVLKTAEKYNIAKYIKNELSYQRGVNRYPLKLSAITDVRAKEGFALKTTTKNDHLIYKSKHNTIIISQINNKGYALWTHFSICLLLWSAVYFIINFSEQKTAIYTLHFKIRTATIVTVISALIVFAIGSIWFINYEWKALVIENLLSSQRSVVNETERALFGYTTASLNENKSSIEMDLQRLSKIYKTEIHFYNNQGELIASSQPDLFYANILSHKMKSGNQLRLTKGNKNEVTQTEHIGKLSFLSVYSSVFNEKEQRTGFINTPYFNYHNDINGQSNTWLLASLNIFVLLLIAVIAITAAASKRLIKPLVRLQNWVEESRFDTSSFIEYDGSDEIGDVVRAYNLKLLELNQAMEKIRVNERELVWREMAKQIAHEIKNPLTPMKLTLQQILRTQIETSANQEELRKKIQVILNQIDAMAKMANDFSSFARISEPNKQWISLSSLIDNAVHLHEIDNIIKWTNPSDEYSGFLDKNQWTQVMNNLIINAIQATENVKTPKIEVVIKKDEENVIITISDNGIGISKEERALIFTPHFTTKSSGSGIGLSIVRQILDKHDAKIECLSDKKNTTFKIIISNQYLLEH